MSPALGIDWKKGMRVVKILHGVGGYREARLGTVGRVDSKTKTVYFDDGQEVNRGITFDEDGVEKERFFPGFRAEITPLDRP